MASWTAVRISLLLAISMAAEMTSGQIMACYFSNWAGYRQSNGKFEPTDIDPQECTHLMYAYGNINANLMQFQPSDAWADLEDGGGKGYYKKFNALKDDNPELKTLLALGGQADDPYGLWDMAEDPAKRERVIEHGKGFVQFHKFDGVDLSWLFPSSSGGSIKQRENIGAFIRELSEAFHASDPPLLVTASIPPVLPPDYESADDFHALFETGVMDFISVKTMDFHGSWEQFTHHNAPLYPHSKDIGQNVLLNTNTSMLTWLETSGVDPSLLLITIPTSGRGYTLQSSSETDFYSNAYQAGISGPYTQTNGFMGFLELCEMKEKYADSWVETWSEDCQVPYIVFNDFQWWGCDTPESATVKTRYVLDNGFGGVALYTLELDDTHDSCGFGRNSIGAAIKTTLADGARM